MAPNFLNIIGSFADQPQRALTYSTAASALGYTPRIVAELSSLANSEKIEGVNLFTDDSAICEALEWSRKSEKRRDLSDRLFRLSQLSDKYQMRRLTSEGFDHPHHLIKDAAALSNISIEDNEWVCKPRWGSNSRDVRVVTTSCEMRSAAATILERGGQALIEQHIIGRHLCFELYWSGSSLSIIGRCEKAMTNYQTKIVEAFHSLSDLPLRYSELAKHKLQPLLEQVLEGVPCVLHGEFIVEDKTGDLKIAELNPRAPWGMLPEFFSLSGGIDFDSHVVANSIAADAVVPLSWRPVVLGAIFSEDFFDSVDSIESRGNTLFVERFQKPRESSALNNLTKLGRYLLWGVSTEAVNEEWMDLSRIALTKKQRDDLRLDTSTTWQSKCC